MAEMKCSWLAKYWRQPDRVANGDRKPDRVANGDRKRRCLEVWCKGLLE